MIIVLIILTIVAVAWEIRASKTLGSRSNRWLHSQWGGHAGEAAETCTWCFPELLYRENPEALAKFLHFNKKARERVEARQANASEAPTEEFSSDWPTRPESEQARGA